ncbi:MAG: hypothetical protein IJZ53_07500 [Tyzzerella sp.]|nr:hypothetical protein [Tyzzerella sp.]
MTVQEAIEIVTNAVQTDNMTVEQDKALAIVQKALEEVEQYRALGTVEELKEAREKQPKTDWIPCEERLPLPKGNEQMVEVDVTVAGDGRNVRVPAFYFFATCNFHVYGIGGAKIKNVIAWMHKPQPYKADHLGEVNGMVEGGAEHE